MDALLLLAGGLLHELMLFAAIGFVIGGASDLAIDLIWIGTALRAKISLRQESAHCWKRKPATHSKFAIFVPAWDESAVIEAMLDHSIEKVTGHDVDIFVGYYPNDRKTGDILKRVAVRGGRVVPVRAPRPGPTTKADCLNAIWRGMVEAESDKGYRFDAIILHDAEDLIHASELALFDRLLPGLDFVQLPVLPLPDPHSRWIGNSYCDEFAEAHGKAMTVRQSLGAAIPSAGTGCAISRKALAGLAEQRGGVPFDADSLTEDYELGLRIAEAGGKGIFARCRDEDGSLIAVRSHFPSKLGTAVRQKTRWIMGIALSGWDRLGWRGGWAERWMRLRDRGTILAAMVLFAAYAALALAALLGAAALLGHYEMPEIDPLLRVLLWINFGLLIWRLLMRAGFTAHAYGWREGLRAIPRTITSNIVAMMAARRATGRYLFGGSDGAKRWEKTHHVFPDTTLL